MKKTIFILALILSLLPLGAVYHKLGEFDTPGFANSVIVDNGIAYVIDATLELHIINVSNPQNPALLGSYDPPANARCITATNSIAFICAATYYPVPLPGWFTSDLQIINVSNPQNPTQLGSCDIMYPASFITVAGNIAYVGGYFHSETNWYNGWLQLIDISNPQTPTPIGSYHIEDNAYSITVEDSIAYVAKGGTYIDDYSGMQILDVSNPQNPTLLSNYETPNDAYSIGVEGSVACVAEGIYGIQIFSVTNPQNPVLLSSYDTPGDARFVTIVNGLAYVADGESGLQIIDITNPQNPSLVATFHLPGISQSVSVSGGIAYAANGEAGLQIINVANPQNSSLLGSYDTPGEGLAVSVANDLACVADGGGYGLKFIDVSEPYNPILLDTFYIGNVTYAQVVGNVAYAVAGGDILIIDISNPQNISLLGSYATPGQAKSISILSNLAYITDGEWGLEIVDVSNPQSPVLVGSYNTQGEALSVAITDWVAYVSTVIWQISGYYSSDLLCIDISNPQNPTIRCSYDTSGYARTVAAVGYTAYWTNNVSGLNIVNFPDFASPDLITTIMPHATSEINQCYVHGNLLYVSDLSWNEISVYDINNPMTPVLNNRYAWNLGSINMCVANNTLYTANGFGGLNIHNLSTIDNDDEVQYTAPDFQMRIYPNPFNPETIIAYTLPAKGQVCLEIYNSKGQLVKILLNEQQTKGEHSLTWNGKDNAGNNVASGLYLCRISSDGKNESRKMLLLK